MSIIKQLQKLTDSDSVLFIPLGGVGEIGMNAYLYHYKGCWLLVDIGIGFADYRMPGIDTLLPDMNILYELPLDAVLITHSHEDHIGGIAELLEKKPMPVYVGEYSESLVKQKVRNLSEIEFNTIKADESFNIGDFTITPRRVTHSVPEAFAFYFQTEIGVIIHSGDWKYDDNPMIGEGFKPDDWLLKNGNKVEKIKAMICDSTNVMVPGFSGSEELVTQPLQKIIKDSQNYRLFVTCFASNIARMNSIMMAGHQAGRKIMLMGRSMQRMYQAGTKMGWFSDEIVIVTEDNLDNINFGELLIMVTGSQGEGRSMLAKIARGEQKKLKITPNDKVIFSSRTIPGNEIEIGQMQNRIAEQGGEIIFADDEQNIHVSGHYQREEIEATYQKLKPEWVIPIHGEPRHLRAHCKIAKAAGLKSIYLPQNGSVVKIAKNAVEICDIIDCETQLVEPSGLMLQEQSQEFLDRRKIIWNGVLHMALAVDKDDAIQGHPHVTAVGLTIADDMLNQIEDKIIELFHLHYDDDVSLEEIIKRLKTFLRKESRTYLKKRPVITVGIIQV